MYSTTLKTLSILSVLCVVSDLGARENPFFPLSASNAKTTSNLYDAKPPLGSFRHELPDQTRILKEVTFTFQNADGSIVSQTMDIDRSVDWHKPLILHQGNAKQSLQAQSSASTASLAEVQIHSSGKQMTLRAPYALARHFALSNPNRIVIDFSGAQLPSTLTKRLNAAPYQSVSIANHGKFTRLTIVLDGRYGYTLETENGVHIINCK